MKIEPLIPGLLIAALGIFLYLNSRPKELPVPEFIRPLPTNEYIPDSKQLEDIYSRHARPFSYGYNDSVIGWNVDNIHRSFRDYLQNKYTLY